MNNWVILHLKSSWAQKNVTKRLAQNFLNALWFHPKKVVAYKIDEDKIFFCADSIDPLRMGSRFFQNEKRTLVVSGLPYSIQSGQVLSAKHLSEELEYISIEDISSFLAESSQLEYTTTKIARL